jgi:DNA-binding IclR family transcriptional regulator
VPIFGAGGQVSAAISLSMPKTRLRDAQQEKEIIAALRTTADQLAVDFESA